MDHTLASVDPKVDAFLHLTVTIDGTGLGLGHCHCADRFSGDDCDHATLIGIVRRALEGSEEFRQRYDGRLIGLAVPLTDSMNADTYRSAWRV